MKLPYSSIGHTKVSNNLYLQPSLCSETQKIYQFILITQLALAERSLHLKMLNFSCQVVDQV